MYIVIGIIGVSTRVGIDYDHFGQVRSSKLVSSVSPRPNQTFHLTHTYSYLPFHCRTEYPIGRHCLLYWRDHAVIRLSSDSFGAPCNCLRSWFYPECYMADYRLLFQHHRLGVSELEEKSNLKTWTGNYLPPLITLTQWKYLKGRYQGRTCQGTCQ